mmetsp:Transcript_44629/g.104917  ORF Transcript_44629/g.104917 Transcript_44629/m.104917 type:complete len:284 (+) Transcript_44629:1081-1932(+)
MEGDAGIGVEGASPHVQRVREATTVAVVAAHDRVEELAARNLTTAVRERTVVTFAAHLTEVEQTWLLLRQLQTQTKRGLGAETMRTLVHQFLEAFRARMRPQCRRTQDLFKGESGGALRRVTRVMSAVWVCELPARRTLVHLHEIHGRAEVFGNSEEVRSPSIHLCRGHQDRLMNRQQGVEAQPVLFAPITLVWRRRRGQRGGEVEPVTKAAPPKHVRRVIGHQCGRARVVDPHHLTRRHGRFALGREALDMARVGAASGRADGQGEWLWQGRDARDRHRLAK